MPAVSTEPVRSTVRSARGSSRSARPIAGAVSRLAERAGAALRRPRRAPADRRPGAGPEGRQPHRPALHRRLCRRPALRDPAEIRLGPGQLSRRADDGLQLVDCRITNAVRCVPPENKPTAGRDRALPRPSCGRDRALMPSSQAIVALGAIAHDAVLRARPPAEPWPLRPRRAARAADRPHAGRQLSLLALQHEHRPADDRDVPRRVRGAVPKIW